MDRNKIGLSKVWALVFTLCGICLSISAAGQNPTGWWRYEVPETSSYLFRYIPTTLDRTQPAPAIVFLHGSGATPEQWRNLLSPAAEALEVVLLVPKSISTLGWGPGRDDETIRASLALVEGELDLDPQRIAIAGHSSGGAYAYVLALSSVSRFSSVFSLGAPYRTVLEVADPDYTPPIRLYYGTGDPNFLNGPYTALLEEFQRLEAPVEEEIAVGFGHSDWPDTTLEDGFRFLTEQRYQTPGGCIPAPERLCLGNGRFSVEGQWRNARGASGSILGSSRRTDDSGLLYFFSQDNWEVLIKVLEACGVNGHYWVFTAASTTVGYDLTVTDLATGETRIYGNPVGTKAEAVTDTQAFRTCP